MNSGETAASSLVQSGMHLAKYMLYGEMPSVGEFKLSRPRNVTIRGRSPPGNPSGSLTTM